MKLTDLPKTAEPAVIEAKIDESIEAAAPQDNPGMYGVDPSSPEAATLKKRLKLLQKTDPDLYARVMSMD